MSTFFQQTAQAMIAKHIDRFPLLKLDQVIDWQPIEQYLNRQRTRYLRDHRGRPAYPLLSMFKAILLGQWHSLSDPELEHSLITRIDFNLFCRFDELSIPDYSTLCRYRNWVAQDDTLSELLVAPPFPPTPRLLTRLRPIRSNKSKPKLRAIFAKWSAILK